MKKFIASLFTAFALSTVSVYADTNVFVNDRLVEYSDQAPVIVNDRTYIPIRDVFEALGYKVDWNGEIKTVELSNDYYTAVLYTQTSGMFVSDTALTPYYFRLENEIKIINGRTMLPLREILESMGYRLDWDAETKSTYISDVNDYTYLEKNRQTVQKLLNGAEIAIPNDDLNDEERAFAAQLILAACSDTKILFDDLSSENAEQRKELVEKRREALYAIPCPERFKTTQKNVSALLDRIEADIDNLCLIYNANGGSEYAGLTPVLTMRFGIDKEAYEAFETLIQ